ncbi:MAG: GAF domain-containing protein, partial [Gemmatimonadaceae bacterium]
DSRDDSRLTSHSARDSIISYVGVPLRLASGCTWGTLCHYDLRPRLLSPSETAILESVAPLFVRTLVPGNPTLPA